MKAAGPRRNVLMIAVDDLKPYLGCYGHTAAISPNIDKLASRGTVFTHAYCQQAVCSPSRTSLLTGRRPDTTKVYELQTHFRKTLPDVVTLPQHFKNHGYVTSGLGKIFHGGLDDDASWSIPAWWPNGPAWNTPANADRAAKRTAFLKERGWKDVQPVPRRAGEPKKGPSWEAPDVTDHALPDGMTADTVIQALQHVQGKPFFLGAGFFKPHLPFIAPKRYHDLYRDRKFTAADNPFPPKGAPAVAMHTSGELRTYDDISDEGPVPEAKALELIRAYYAALSYTDAQIGRVLAELDRLGLRENTVVVLWGDHGWHLGDHGLWNKHSNFEQATHAPLVVSAPGQKHAGRKTAGLTEFVDIYPSLCELAGLPKAEGLEGLSFAPLLENPDRPWKKAAFSQYPHAAPGVGQVMGYTMRTDRYRFTEWALPAKNFHEVELYDYETDPK
ncbi:MAG: sulfatase, partial [Bryobacteraceae bacterium]